MVSTSATFTPAARAIEVATCATSSAWVSRVRWWSLGYTTTWVLPANRRKAVECTIRSRSRSKQVRSGSGASGTARRPAPWARGAPGRRVSRSRCSRSSRSPTGPGPTSAREPACARTRAPSACPAIVSAQARARGEGSPGRPDSATGDAELGVRQLQVEAGGVVEPVLGEGHLVPGCALPAAGAAELADRERLLGVKPGQLGVQVREGAHQTEAAADVTADREALQVPGHVLAQLGAAVPLVTQTDQQLGMPANHGRHLAERGQGSAGPAGEGVRQVSEQPGSTQAAAADDHTVHPGLRH